MKNHLILGISLFCLSFCYGQNKFGKTSLQGVETQQKIDALVQEYLDLDTFSGVVLIAEDGNPVYHKAFGLADRTQKIKNTVNTKFDIGSMNKTFTKIVILQLIEEGKLNLTDTLGKYLKGFPEMPANTIQINHLLNHSSGYGDYYQSPGFFDLPTSEKTIKALVKRIQKMPLFFDPGTEQEYSNSGYILLGAIIEKITNKSYQENVLQRIVKPLQLNNTYVVNKSEVPDRAIGYFKTMRGEIRDNNKFAEVANPDGGFHATALDILKFYREFHYGEKILSMKSKLKDEFFGMIQGHKNTGGAIPHAGGFNGANTVNYEILRDKISIVVFANMDEPVAEQLGKGILDIVRGKEPTKPQLPAIQTVYQSLLKKGATYVKENFNSLIVNFHPTDPKDIVLNQVGYGLINDGDVSLAIEAFQLNTELFPENPNVWDSLGEAYYKKGDTKEALKHYKKALSIDPYFPSAQKMIQKLEKK